MMDENIGRYQYGDSVYETHMERLHDIATSGGGQPDHVAWNAKVAAYQASREPLIRVDEIRVFDEELAEARQALDSDNTREEDRATWAEHVAYLEDGRAELLAQLPADAGQRPTDNANHEVDGS